MSCTGTSDCSCGCCAGTSVQTPQLRNNLSGLSSISYRVGTWASFKESMLARLSSSDYPVLAGLKTRQDDDFTIALLDASAIVLDILTFYQERLANESYLRTAGQLQSLVELSRLIGYQPSPGVSASAYVAFTLKAAPGQAPDPSTPAITIPQGSQVQSVPTQGQTAQTFETSSDISAKADWNALPLQTGQPWAPQSGDTFLYLQGVSTQLQPGDSFLIVGENRVWNIGTVTTVTPDSLNNRTYVEWGQGLGDQSQEQQPEFYAFRQRASLFGYNAVNPLMLAGSTLATLNGGIQSSPPPMPHAGASGAGYAANELVIVDAGDSNAVLQIQTVDINGVVNGPLTVINPGTGYTSFTGAGTTLIAPPQPPTIATPDSTPAVEREVPDKAVLNTGTGVTDTSVAVTGINPVFVDGLLHLLAVDFTAYGNLLNSAGTDWNFAEAAPGGGLVDLDATYSKLVPGGWVVLNGPPDPTSGSSSIGPTLYQIQSVTTISRSAYGVSGRITRLQVDSDANLSTYYNAARTTSVLAQGEQLAVAEKPLNYPLYGTLLDLQDLRPDLANVQVVALFGKRQKIMVAAGNYNLAFVPDDGTATLSLNPGDILTLIAPPSLNSYGSFPDWSQSGNSATLSVEDANGRTGTVGAELKQFTLTPAGANDPNVSEYALVSQAPGVVTPYPHTQIQLMSPLSNCYDRYATTVNANVALVTNGSSVSEIMGNGSAATPNQNFTLRQSPLTYVSAPTPTGRQSSLQVQVNGVTWTEVPSLYGQGPSDAVFATLNQANGTTDVLFGDGVEGATLPTGQNNIQAYYRVGLGSGGNVPANTLTTLLDRPLGVSGVSNPEAASGGQDAQLIEDVRSNAPQTVLTLGRAVSLADYQNFATSFAGIAKAYALWIPGGTAQGVFLTVAGVNGTALPPGSPTLGQLVKALHLFGNPLVPITVVSFVETLFGLSADLQYDPAYDRGTVKARVLQALYQSFGFAARSFGQGVWQDEVATVIQAVPGVVAVNVKGLVVQASSTGGDLGPAGILSLEKLRNWRQFELALELLRRRPTTTLVPQIYPYLPVANPKTLPTPAEILVLNPDSSALNLGVMQ